MEIPAPSAVRPEIPPELDRIVLKALERDRDKRYQTAQDMARDLDAFLAAQAFRSEDAIAFVQELVASSPRASRPRFRRSTSWPGAQTRPRRRSRARPRRRPSDAETAATVPGKGTRSYFSERFRTSRVGRFLLGRPRE